jgi:hypothetical protein
VAMNEAKPPFVDSTMVSDAVRRRTIPNIPSNEPTSRRIMSPRRRQWAFCPSATTRHWHAMPMREEEDLWSYDNDRMLTPRADLFGTTRYTQQVVNTEGAQACNNKGDRAG